MIAVLANHLEGTPAIIVALWGSPPFPDAKPTAHRFRGQRQAPRSRSGRVSEGLTLPRDGLRYQRSGKEFTFILMHNKSK